MLTKLERRRRSQRGSILSGLLIIVAFLSIIGAALMSEISSQFLMTRNLVDQVTAEATVQSGMENAIAQLQSRAVPFRCSTDQPSPIGPIAVNSQSAAANTIACRGIVPDVARGLIPGAFTVDGTRVAIPGHHVYLAGDQGGDLVSYEFGSATLKWRLSLGHAVTASPAEMAYSGHYLAAVPDGSRVTLVTDFGSGAAVGCSMPANGTVKAQPGFGSNTAFPAYTFFGDALGQLYAFDPDCRVQASSALSGGGVVGNILVLPGTVTTNRNGGACGDFGGGDEDRRVTTTTADVIALVSNGFSSTLVDVAYSEDTDGSSTRACLKEQSRRSLSFGSAQGVSFFASGNTTRAAISFAAGQVQLATITASRRSGGSTYSLSRGQSVSLGGSITTAPNWWSTTGNEVGVADGSSLFVFDSGLRQLFRYDGAAAINTTPAADTGGDWYFGADDGYAYDVEPPASGATMFKAARFGPGGQVRSSPIVGGSADGCAGNACLYFGSFSNGAYFVQIGNIRVMELRSCITSGTTSTACISASPKNPSLWARLEVGNPTYLQGRSVNVIGWSYSNGP